MLTRTLTARRIVISCDASCQIIKRAQALSGGSHARWPAINTAIAITLFRIMKGKPEAIAAHPIGRNPGDCATSSGSGPQSDRSALFETPGCILSASTQSLSVTEFPNNLPQGRTEQDVDGSRCAGFLPA